MAQCVKGFQISEDVIKDMQSILGDAQSEYKGSQVDWCWGYMKLMRSEVLNKFDNITAKILEYIEEFSKYKKGELEQKKNLKSGKEQDNKRPYFFIDENTRDFKLGILGILIPGKDLILHSAV